MGRSAFVVRREGRYLFRTRWPRCLSPVFGAESVRIALGTAAYPVALRRASRIASWLMRLKAAQTREQVLGELYPLLRGMAVRPVQTMPVPSGTIVADSGNRPTKMPITA